MKKIMSLFLALCMCLCIAPCTFVSAADGDVLASYTFDALTGVVNSPEHTEGESVPGFHAKDGKLVYDTTTSGVAETTNAARTATISKTITGQKMSMVMELCIENSFPSNTTNFQGRFCGANAAGGTQLKNLISMTYKGLIYVDNTKQAQLELGKTHKITLELVPNETNTDYTKYLYVDGVSFGQAPVGLTNASNLDFYAFIINLNNKNNKATKFSLDNFIIYEGLDDEVTGIEGQEEYNIPKAGRTVEKQYKINLHHYSGETTDAEWSVVDNPSGISVDENGKLTMTSDVAEGTYTLQAVFDSQTLTKEIVVSDIEYQYSVVGDSDVYIKDEISKIAYTLEDQFNNVEEATWTVSPTTPYVSVSEVDGIGVLKITPEAESGEYTITATSKYDNTATAEKTVTLTLPANSIEGSSVITLPSLDVVSKVEFALKDEFGALKNAVWSIQDEEALQISADGVLTLDANSKEGNYVIVAEFGGKTYEKEITIQAGSLFDYEKEVAESLPTGWEKDKDAAVKEENGNKYIYSTDGRFTKYFLDTPECTLGTVQWKMRYREDRTDSRPFYIVNSDHEFYFKFYVKHKDGMALIQHENGEDVAVTEFGKWIDFRTEHDTQKQTVTLIVDNKYSKTFEYAADNKIPTDVKIVNPYEFDIDDLMYYSGRGAASVINTNLGSVVTIPNENSTTEIKVDATLVTDGEETSTPVICTLKESYDGVTLENNILKITNAAQEGNIALKLIAGEVVKNLDIKLINSVNQNTGTVTLPDDYEDVNPLVVTVNLADAPNDQIIKLSDSLEFKLADGEMYKIGNESSKVAVNASSVFKFTLNNGKYIASVDGNIIDEAETVENIVTIENNLGYIYVGSPLEGAKGVLSHKLGGTEYVGQRLVADYTYFNESGTTDYTAEVNWFVDGTKVGDGDFLLLKEDYIGKPVHYEIRITSDGDMVATGISEDRTVSAFLSASVDGVNATVTAPNIWGTTEVLVFVVINKGIGQEFEIESDYHNLTDSDSVFNQTFVIGDDTAKVFVVDKETLKPLCMEIEIQ